MSKNYEPENQFLERLEWQLSSEFRRTDRLKSSPEKVALSRRMVAVSLMLGIFMTGVAMIKATEYIRDTWRKKIEVARFETEVKLKEVRLESIREILSRVEIQYANGLIPEQEVQGIRLSLERAGLDLKKSALNLEEVKASGKSPRNELYAPLVRGRDFVSERLQLEVQGVELDLALVKEHFVYYKERVETGVMEERELEHIQAEIAAQNAKISSLQKKLDLRSRFLSGEITAQEIEIRDRMAVAEKNLHMAQSKVDAITRQIKDVEIRVDAGMMDELELTQMQYALNAAQAELDLAVLEMDVLKKIR